MQVPILSGVYTDATADYRTYYPRNLIPVPKPTGISKGYLRPADGVELFATGPGVDRGGVNWNGILYRVMGSKLCRISSSGAVTIIGDVGGSIEAVELDYSFDRLAISSIGNFFYYDGSTLYRVTDEDLGPVYSFIWVDGYFMTTDGVNLVVTELNDPTSVNPLKYGSAEADPDGIQGLLKVRNEPYAIGRYTIESFQNVGGTLFPFQRVTGSQIMRGAIGSRAFCVFAEAIAFVGSGKDEPCAVWLGSNGKSDKISTGEIDTILQEYSEDVLANITLESRVDKGHAYLYIHLPDRTVVYDYNATLVAKEPVWFTLTTSVIGNSIYKVRNLVWCYDAYIVGDPTSFKIGKLTYDVASHYGEIVGWEFNTTILYNGGNGGIFHEMELQALHGRAEFEVVSTIWTSYSIDGLTWSQERPKKLSKRGNRTSSINWLALGHMRKWRIQKFRGLSDAFISPTALECRIEALS